MKTKLMGAVTGIMVVTFIHLLGHVPTLAAPEKELKIAVVTLGVEKPVPRFGSGDPKNKNYLKLLYDPLVGSNPDGSLSTDMGLARKWEMSPDGLTWTFSLRKGIKFHDGVELTAKDAKFSIEMLMKPDSTSDYAREVRYAVRSVEGNDPYTVVVRCKQPSPFLPNSLSDVAGQEGLIVPKDAYERIGEEAFMKRPIGSGPYKFHSHVLGTHLKVEAMEKPHWRDGTPRYKYVTFRIIPEESTRIAMLKTGEVNIADITRESAKEIKKAGFNVVSKRSSNMAMVGCCMQYRPGPMSDIRFRKALALAADYDAIVEYIFGGMARRSVHWPGKSILQCGGDPSLKPHAYDPEEARRLIKEGGWEGHEFIVASYPRGGVPEIPRMVEALVGYWQKIGLKPKILMTDYNAWKDKLAARKTENSITIAISPTASVAPVILSYYRAYMHSKTHQTLIEKPEIDEMIEKAFSSLDPAEAQKLTGTLHRYFHNNYTWISIAEIDAQIATAKEIPAWDPGTRRYEDNYNDLIRQR
jgi:peptide/nickel transport system substrate-binding protein